MAQLIGRQRGRRRGPSLVLQCIGLAALAGVVTHAFMPKAATLVEHARYRSATAAAAGPRTPQAFTTSFTTATRTVTKAPPRQQWVAPAASPLRSQNRRELVVARAGASAAQANNIKSAVLAAATLLLSIQPAVMMAASKAVLKLVSSCAIGYGFSKKGVLDQAALTSLSRLVFYIFQPCLLFVNVASTLAMPGRNYSKLFVLPIFACLQILAGSLVANGMGKVMGIDGSTPEGRELRMCASFANSGPLPLLFVDSLFGGHPDPTLLPTAVAYISFYLLGWSPMFWTAGYAMLAGTPPRVPTDAWPDQGDRELSLQQKVVVAAQEIRSSPTFKRIVSPPVLGCVAGAVVGLCPPLRALLVGRGALLSPLFDALKALGTAYLPAAILVLAGSLARPAPAGPAAAATAAGQPGEGSRPGGIRDVSGSLFAQPEFLKRVAAVMVSRFMLMPLAAAAMLLTGSRVGAVPYDRLLWFVLLMEGCMPSAQNSVVILQMEKKPELAASMARTLTAVYLLSALPIAALLSAILQFVKL